MYTLNRVSRVRIPLSPLSLGKIINTTKLLYLSNMSQLICDSHVVEVQRENDRDIIILDQTVFYPQGGGQPYDQGTISGSIGAFKVQEVRFVDGIVKHIGNFVDGILKVQDKVSCIVDEKRRNLNAKLHSAGHIIDMVVSKLNLPWAPGKGFHFPDGPYVEYSGALEQKNIENLAKNIECQVNQLIEQKIPVEIKFVTKDQVHLFSRFSTQNLPDNKPIRIVLYNDFGTPCGGIHVKNSAEIGNIIIRKIKIKGNIIRVSYDVLDENNKLLK